MRMGTPDAFSVFSRGWPDRPRRLDLGVRRKLGRRAIETPRPRPSAGGKGDIVEKCHTNAIRSKRRLPTYRFQIPEGSFGVADAHQAAAESLTVPWAASFGLRMLKRLTLRFSARITRDREPTFRSRNNETFALANGLRIAEHGWPQSFAVSIIRRARVDLEREHARILRQSPDKLFDQEAIRAGAREGDIYFF